MKWTAELRKGADQLIVSFCQPHKPICRDTLARWTLWVLKEAGIDIAEYCSHSTRGASASAAKRPGASLNLIMKQVGWRNEDPFAQFYNKELEQELNLVDQMLLQNAVA